MTSQFAIDQAARYLASGGIVAYPTEAVYGLGCDPDDARAVYRLLALKRRNPEHGLILIAAHMGQLEPYLAPLDPSVRERLEDSWPGPVTWVVPADRDAPAWLTGGRATIAVRVTAHRDSARLCARSTMPLVSTSANRSGCRPARSALQVRCAFGHRVDYILGGGVGALNRPTEIRNALDGRVLRPGES